MGRFDICHEKICRRENPHLRAVISRSQVATYSAYLLRHGGLRASRTRTLHQSRDSTDNVLYVAPITRTISATWVSYLARVNALPDRRRRRLRTKNAE